MNKAGCAAVLAASVALAAFAAEKPRLWVSCTSEVDNVSNASSDWSGITYAGDNLYYVVDDKTKKMYSVTMKIAAGGSPKASNIAITNSWDIGVDETEGCAYDPGSGRIWISRESDSSIREFDLVSKKFVRTAPVPAIFNRVRENFSLEALTISGDGLTMWICNEEALVCDGNRSSLTNGTIVRLTRFSRPSVHDNWTPSGQWAYKTERIAKEAQDHGNKVWYPTGNPDGRRGVAALTALPDGTLLVLERGYFGWGEVADDLEWYLYAVDSEQFKSGWDISNLSKFSSLSTTTNQFKYVEKKKLWGDYKTKTNYEGMCLGPSLSTNSVALVLVSERGGSIMTIELSGINVRTLNLRRYTEEGVLGFSERNYRYLDGTPMTIHNPGEGIAETWYTNRGDRVFASEWSLRNHGYIRKKGSVATFNLKADDTLCWFIHKQENANTLIFAHDTFEEYAPNKSVSSVKKWNGDVDYVAVVPQTYTPQQGERMRILKSAPHKNVLDATDGATRSLKTNVNGIQRFRVDIMLEIQRSPKERLEEPPDNPRFAIAADTNGCLNLWYRKCNGNTVSSKYDWGQLNTTQFSDGDWVRVSFKYVIPTHGQAFASVLVNNIVCSVEGGKASCSLDDGASKGPWFPVSGTGLPDDLVLAGTKADDFIMAAPGYIDTVHPSASIMVAPSEGSGASGEAAVGGQAYTVTTAVPAPVAAPATASAGLAVSAAGPSAVFAVPAPAITGFGITSAKLPRIEFIGYVGGVEYRVLCSSTIDFRNATAIAGKIVETRTDDEGNGVVAVWEGNEPDSLASGAKFYRVEVVGAAAE